MKSKKQKLFNPGKYQNWHGVGFGSWTGTATDAKEKHKQKEAAKKAALKAEQEQKRKEFKELQDKKKAAQRQKRKRIAEKAKKIQTPKGPKMDKSKKPYKHKRSKVTPKKTGSGKYSAAIGLFHNTVVFGCTYATAEECKAVLDHKLKLKNDLFNKIELTKQQAFELNTYNLFKNYLLTEDAISYRLILRMYGKEQ